MIGFILSVCVFGLAAKTGIPSLLYGCSFLAGFFLSPCLTIGIELACEVAFPVGESYANGIIQMTGNVTGIVLTLYLPMILDGT